MLALSCVFFYWDVPCVKLGTCPCSPPWLKWSFVCYFWNGLSSFIIGGHFLQSPFHFHFKIPDRGFLQAFTFPGHQFDFPSICLFLGSPRESLFRLHIVCAFLISGKFKHNREHSSWRSPYPHCWPTPSFHTWRTDVKMLPRVLWIVTVVGYPGPVAGSQHAISQSALCTAALFLSHFLKCRQCLGEIVDW